MCVCVGVFTHSHIPIADVRALLATLPPESLALVEYLCNFLIIAVQFADVSLFTLPNGVLLLTCSVLWLLIFVLWLSDVLFVIAALLFAPVFLSFDTRRSQDDAKDGAKCGSHLTLCIALRSQFVSRPPSENRFSRLCFSAASKRPHRWISWLDCRRRQDRSR